MNNHQSPLVHQLDKSIVAAYGQDFGDLMKTVANESRSLVGAHQSAISYIPDGNFKKAIHQHSFSEKYEKWNTYDAMPTGKGIWGVIVERNIPMRLTDAELKSHMRWRNFSDLKDARGLEHPPYERLAGGSYTKTKWRFHRSHSAFR